MVMFFFSSRRRHTRYWRDWSSDVCSSDLVDRHRLLDDGVDVVLALAAQADAAQRLGQRHEVGDAHRRGPALGVDRVQLGVGVAALVEEGLPLADHAEVDRKSTRLNSSHANISYAVFCLKKKTIT